MADADNNTPEEWRWYVGNGHTAYTTECDTREQAVEIALEEYECAYICEALKTSVPLSEFFDVDHLIEIANDSDYVDHGGDSGNGTPFDAVEALVNDLAISVRRTIDAWQKGSGLTFMPYSFTRKRNEEYIKSPNTPISEK